MEAEDFVTKVRPKQVRQCQLVIIGGNRAFSWNYY